MNFMLNLLGFFVFSIATPTWNHVVWTFEMEFRHYTFLSHCAFDRFLFDYYELFMNVWGNSLIKCKIHEPYWMQAQQFRYHIISVSINRSSFDIMQHTRSMNISISHLPGEVERFSILLSDSIGSGHFGHCNCTTIESNIYECPFSLAYSSTLMCSQ